MWAIGWRKAYEGLKILGRYRHKQAIKKNPARYEALMEDSARAGEDQSPYGFASNLAYSSNGLYNHQHKDDGDESELPLAVAMVLPTSKKTGAFAPKGYQPKG
ncbi:hypothetical protein PGTUg99_013677 [Puccinia graminis f. sp. tritici]|uniref:Tet-like 2OG-Fe(II) oxygenase domain-containing protein n=1 Tax=Puccinia graminis f. sp. tritici TaxID=56615 RepID=A0A5B0SBS9_PUCGR|nr:hypothetical protein PGTUg99_013677 [Puccinia graminis f. sp. tritici]